MMIFSKKEPWLAKSQGQAERERERERERDLLLLNNFKILQGNPYIYGSKYGALFELPRIKATTSADQNNAIHVLGAYY